MTPSGSLEQSSRRTPLKVGGAPLPALGWRGREEETGSPPPCLLPDLLGRSLISTMKGHERSSQATSSDNEPVLK